MDRRDAAATLRRRGPRQCGWEAGLRDAPACGAPRSAHRRDPYPRPARRRLEGPTPVRAPVQRRADLGAAGAPGRPTRAPRVRRSRPPADIRRDAVRAAHRAVRGAIGQERPARHALQVLSPGRHRTTRDLPPWDAQPSARVRHEAVPGRDADSDAGGSARAALAGVSTRVLADRHRNAPPRLP